MTTEPQTSSNTTISVPPKLELDKDALIYSSFFYRPKLKEFRKLHLVSSSKILPSPSPDLDEKPETNDNTTIVTAKNKPNFVLDCCSVLMEKIPKYRHDGPKPLEPYIKMKLRDQFQERLKKILSSRSLSKPQQPVAKSKRSKLSVQILSNEKRKVFKPSWDKVSFAAKKEEALKLPVIPQSRVHKQAKPFAS